MRLTIRIYLALVSMLALGWLVLISISGPSGQSQFDLMLAGAIALYVSAHGVRMMRLGLLTLDEREKIIALLSAHVLTAFPSALIPFKIGELLRLAAFCHVFELRRKAIAVWLAERFGDVLVIAVLILALNLFDVELPDSMRWVFLLFVLASVFGLLGLFAVSTTFVYLNRHLVLASHSSRGLFLLKASHSLRSLELGIQRSVEGRISGLLLLSILIWVLEISAFTLFTQRFTEGTPDVGTILAAGLLESLPGGTATSSDFAFYQSLTLVAMTFVFLAGLMVAARLRGVKA